MAEATFGVGCTKDIKEKGDRLLDAIKKEFGCADKGEALGRMIDMAAGGHDDTVLRTNGVNTAALEAAFSNIRTYFLAAVTGVQDQLQEKDTVIAGKDRDIARISHDREEQKAKFQEEINSLKAQVKEAEKERDSALKDTAAAKQAAEDARKQAAAEENLSLERKKTIDTLTAKVQDADKKAELFAALQDKLEKEQDARRAAEDAARQAKKDAEKALKDAERDAAEAAKQAARDAEKARTAAEDAVRIKMQATIDELHQKLQEASDALKDAALQKEQAVIEKERAMQEKLTAAQMDAAGCRAQAELLRRRVKELEDKNI